MIRPTLALALLFAFSAISPAGAASFDCAKAATAREKLICADPALSAADDKLAKSYQAALEPLSAAGQKELRDSERAWLRFADTICRTGRRQIPTPANRYDTPTSCLEVRYAVRQRQLDHATVALGGFVFVRVETFAARPSDDSNRFVKRDIAYPQIDRPRSDAEQRWNAAIRERAGTDAQSPTDNPDTDVWLDFGIKNAASALIATVFETSWYGHGAAHPNSGLIAFNWLLPAARLVQPSDVFDLGTAWQDQLAQLAFAQLQQQVEAHDFFVKSAAEIRDAVGRPERWVIEQDGLRIMFQQYEVGPYVLGQPEVLLPWSALTPILNRQSALPIPPR